MQSVTSRLPIGDTLWSGQDEQEKAALALFGCVSLGHTIHMASTLPCLSENFLASHSVHGAFPVVFLNVPGVHIVHVNVEVVNSLVYPCLHSQVVLGSNIPLLLVQNLHWVSPAALKDPGAHLSQVLNPGSALNVPALQKTHLSRLLVVAL